MSTAAPVSAISPLRVRDTNRRPVRPDGTYVLYWMTAARRARYNFALQRALEWAEHLHRPLLVLESVRVGYPWASDRLHVAILEGMAANSRDFAGSAVQYYPYVEPSPGAGKGLLEALALPACVVITDDYPCFFLPRMLAAAARQLTVKLEAVDGNGVLPLRDADRVYLTAASFRRFLQHRLPQHLRDFPLAEPLSGRRQPSVSVPNEILRRWPPTPQAELDDPLPLVARLSIDHAVTPIVGIGGRPSAERTLQRFLATRLAQYDADRNQPDEQATSQLSPALHFGWISTHQILQAVWDSEGWSLDHLAKRPNGSRSGWWQMSPSAEAFLDQLVTWRELGFNRCCHDPNYMDYCSLPDWAQQTLADHAADIRPYLYTLEQFEQAQTHDEIWNAAQWQLRTEGTIHNYLRMLWGKKILEWSESPQAALATMIELNDKYALDGRDPNSYSGIFWILGRYDRPWGPERPIFGKIRYMSSENTRRKLRLNQYLARYSPDESAAWNLRTS